MRRRLLSLTTLFALILASLIVLTGCGISFQSTDENHDEQAVQMLEEIYDDDFEFVEKEQFGFGGPFDGVGYELTLKSKKFPNKDIKMTYYYDQDTKEDTLSRSNYNFIRFEEKVYEKLNILADIYQDYKIQISTTDPKHSSVEISNCSFEEYISSENDMEVVICLPPSVNSENKGEDIQKLQVLLKENKILIGGNIKIYYVNDEQYFDEIDEKNINEYELSQGKYICGSFYMNEDYEWENYSRWINE